MTLQVAVTEWDGYDDTEPAVGDGVFLTENANYFIQGRLARRPGFGSRIANGGIVVGEVNGRVIFVTSSGTIESEVQ